MGGLLEFVARFGTEERCIESLGRASLARRLCVCRVRRTGGMAAEDPSKGLRVQQVPPAGIGHRRYGVSSDADGSREVVSRRLPDGP